MNDELNTLHHTVSNLLSDVLHSWGDAVTQTTAGADGNKFLRAVQALQTIHNVLTPLVADPTASTTTPPEGAGHGG
ncbi:hypothetical protein [Chitinimonas sp. BJB300]|uniref:hypothetical protein n=1 Tax=Chitinimonas sp. BJB300 TaxID=1559339 RepID=UPI000C0D58B9|nr:hypothetical protein [Chitinimonas sp. BJB300]PHV09712.1 hypothetical protein CSQ89_20190 [Chitinimonas sp. BJB300]TSJ91294.1 hypothetical protein FG002_003105 [Chitinimonas sp. BJB300]